MVMIEIENIKKLSLYAQSIDSEKDRDLFYERFLQQTKKTKNFLKKVLT